MVSARNIVVGVLFFVFALIVTISVTTHGFVPQSKQPITSNLPIVVIRMDSDTDVDVDTALSYTTAWMDIIGDMGGPNTFHLPYDDNAVTERYKIGIHIRGQSTRGSQKKPFSVKMYDYDNNDELKKKDYSLFGFPKAAKFALYSATVDSSLMRNQLSFELTRRIGRYAPRMQFVELFIVPTNTTTDIYYPQHYNGYEDLLSERIDRGEDFVDVQKMKEEDNSGEEITGGYIFKIDKWGDEQDMSEVFTTNYANYIITEPSDEVLTDEKFTYLYDYVTNVEQTLMSPNFTSPAGLHYSDLIDVDSFVDTFIIQELSKNVDAYRLSSYFHKDRSKKMKDLDRTYGNELFNTNQPEGFMVTVPNYHVSDVPKFWQHLVTDPNFTAKLKKRWKHLRGDKYKTKNIISLISEYQQQLEDSGAAYRNYNRWGDWYFPFMFWVTENYSTYHIRTVKEWTEKRLEWLDEAIAALP